MIGLVNNPQICWNAAMMKKISVLTPTVGQKLFLTNSHERLTQPPMSSS